MESTDTSRVLSAQDILAGSSAVHAVAIPASVLSPGGAPGLEGLPGLVRLRPLRIGTLALISRAAREDASLVPLLIIKESLVEPALTLDQVRLLHAGLVQYLVLRINALSGLSPDGDDAEEAARSPLGRTQLLLARHFGWTPEQVSQLTPGQVAVYLAGLERLQKWNGEKDRPS